MSEQRWQRATDNIAAMATRGFDLVTFWEEASEVMRRAVPHYMAPCWYTLDPMSLLVTSHYQTGIPQIPVEWFAHEYYADDVHKFSTIARSERGFSTIHEATGGDPGRSPGWTQFVRPLGGDQELLVVLRTRTGDAWGMLGLYREPGEPQFTMDEIRFLRTVAPVLAEGARRGLLVGEAADPEGPDSPGLVVLRDDWSVESLTPGVERWLAELSDGNWEAHGKLPPAVLAVAGRALRTSENPDMPGEVAIARVLASSGRWMVLHGATLVSSGSRRVAVIIEPAHPARISSLLMAAYGLTEREQDVTRLVLQGNSTVDIAGQLSISTQTVQQHLKNIFDKTGVRSRRDLVGKVFFSHYEPRVRDNEHRAAAARPLRGGPMEHPE